MNERHVLQLLKIGWLKENGNGIGVEGQVGPRDPPVRIPKP